MGHNIDVQYATDQPGLPGPDAIARWAGAALADVPGGLDLTIRIVGEQEGLELNRRWRGADRPTNVLSFPAGNPVVPSLLGDVVLCAPVVLREALEQGKPAEAHWAHLVVHGLLHLRGYDHGNERDAGVMEALETERLRALDFPDPYE